MMTSKSKRYDLVVVGGGTAGLVAAKTAARFGATVVLVEPERLGGDCLWTGCVPSKTLLATARSGPPDDVSAVFTRVRSAIEAVAPKDSVTSVEDSGASVVHGTARFTGPDRVEVAQVDISFRQAVLATGAGPTVPPIPGLTDVDYLTSNSVWSLTTLPEQLTILGGGSIGCELGQAFARLGAQVTLIEAEDRVIPQEDPPASALVLDALRTDGVDVRLGQPVEKVGRDSVTLVDGRTVSHSQLLVAVGRTPRTGKLGLDAAEVATDSRGYVQVDSGLRTTNRRIWAAGDLTGHPQFTHVAGMHGSLAATNAVLGLRRSTKGLTIPRVTFTSPEVAAVGVSPADAATQHLRTTTIQHRDIDRAVTDDEVTGYTTLVSDRRGRIVGATIVGPRAGESVGEATLAVQEGITTSTLASTVHAYPTFNDAIWDAAVADAGRQLNKPVIGAAIAVLAWVQRRRRP